MEGSRVSDFKDIVVSALAPYVGQTVADTCVRATALSLGKTSDDLSPADLAPLASNVRRLLGPIAPATTIAAILQDIETRVA